MPDDAPELVSAPPSLTVSDGRATIRLNRPALHNRLEPADLAALSAHVATVEEDRAIRVLVITAEGKSFCSGYDLGTVAASAAGGQTAESRPSAFGDMVDRVEACRVPTIVALNGGVYGGGTDLALACDFRLGIAQTRMFMPAGQIGLHYYHGGLRRYVTRLGLSAAKRLHLLGETIDAEEMRRIGFLDEVLPDLAALRARTDAIATLIADAPSAEVMQEMKRSLDRIARGDLDPTGADAAWARSRRSPIVAQAVAARLAARKRS
jgi:enoyl-CoA hydratase/carnithine racemase